MNPSHENHDSAYDAQIDAALRLLGGTGPRPGLEQRITARLANTPASRPGFARVSLFGLPRLALASAAALVAFVAIVAGSVSHSRHQLAIAPGMPLPAASSGGMSTASAQKVAPRPVTPPIHGRPRSMRRLNDEPTNSYPDSSKSNHLAVPRAPLPR